MKTQDITAETLRTLLAGIAPADALKILNETSESLAAPTLEGRSPYFTICDRTTKYTNQRPQKKGNQQQQHEHNEQHFLILAKEKTPAIENDAPMNIHALDRLTPLQKTALDLLKWCRVVARLEPDSPRLIYYASRWNVLDKINRSKAAGTFSADIAGCKPIGLEHLQAGMAAVQECHAYSAMYSGFPKPGTGKHAKLSKPKKPKAGECCHDSAPAGQSDKFIA